MAKAAAMAGETDEAGGAGRRLDVIDIARGVALLAMASYHFAWDLAFFGFIDQDVTGDPGWRLYAHLIAASFLLLVGVGLALGHDGGIRWRGFFRRFVRILLAAAAVSAATYVAFPDGFVYFGILHHIALASLVGLAVLRAPPAVVLAAALAALVMPAVVTLPGEGGPMVWLTGLADWVRPSNDFVPLLPWIAAPLAGIAVTRIAIRHGLVVQLVMVRARARFARGLAWLGRHSLAVYLLHQPALYGLVLAASLVVPADAVRERTRLVDGCIASCADMGGDAALCERHCGCVADRLDATDVFRHRQAEAADRMLVEEASAICAAGDDPGADTGWETVPGEAPMPPVEPLPVEPVPGEQPSPTPAPGQ